MCALLLSSGRTPCHGQTAELLHNFLRTWNSICSYLHQTQSFLVGRTQSVLVHRTQSFSCCGELNLFLCTSNSMFFLLWQTQLVLVRQTQCFSYCVKLEVFYSTLQRVYSTLWAGPSILHTNFVKSPVSGLFINAYSVKSSVILYFALCSRTSLYSVSRVYTTLLTLDSALLCNSELLLHIIILWLCTA